MFEYRKQPQVCVTPKSVLAERFSRWSEARKGRDTASLYELRKVGVRSVGVKNKSDSVSAPSPLSCGHKANLDLPRVCASSWEDPKTMLKSMVQKMKRAASANLFERMARRFAIGLGSFETGRKRSVPSCVRVPSSSVSRPSIKRTSVASRSLRH